MGLQDRDYYRNDTNRGDFFRRLLFGDVTLGTIWGVRVRIHVSLLFLIAFRLLFPGPAGFKTALTANVILFGIILLHEFGHCYAARKVGGQANDVLLWPLGGLAFIDTPRRPWPSFVGTAGGPLANLAICVVCTLLIRILGGEWLLGNPLAQFLPNLPTSLSGVNSNVIFYLWWINSTSMSLLLFNLLPIYPLDGGSLLQTMLWPRLGYYRSMNAACITGMVAAAVFGVLSLLSQSLWMVFLCVSGFITCYQTRMNLGALANQAWEDERSYSGNYGGNNHPDRAKVNLPRVNFGKQRTSKPKDDRFTIRDLNPLEWLARRRRRKQFEKLMSDD